MKRIITFSLFILWIVLSSCQIFLIDKSFTALTHRYSKDIFSADTLVSNNGIKKISTHFTSTDNYLGIVSIHFSQENIMTEGRVIFRIKEIGSAHWYYQNSYNALEINQLSQYPFGFPIINNSKNKDYQIEIELQNSNKASLRISKTYPAIITTFKYPKGPLLSSREALFAFIFKRFFNIIQNNYFLFASTIYLLPLVFYILKKTISKYVSGGKEADLIARKIFSITICIISLIDIFFVAQFFELAYVLIFVLWTIIQNDKYDSSQLSYKMGISLIILCMILQPSSDLFVIQKCAAWALMYFTSGLILNTISLNKKQCM